MATSVALELTQQLLTNCARAAAVVLLQACYYVAIPQCSRDVTGGTVGINNGDSDAPLLLYRANQGTSNFEEFQRLNVTGGEGAEFFTIHNRVFLATTSLRSGNYPSYNYNVDSCIFEWSGDEMIQFQCIPTFGAKQWRFFNIEQRHFLGLAQGPGGITGEPAISQINSTIFEWNGDKFMSFQTVPSQMGYNWHYFSLDDRSFLAYADNIELSYILEWNGESFVHFQTLDGTDGRAFHFYEINNKAFLAYARIASDSLVYQWNGKNFQNFQTLVGQGGREFAWIESDESSYLVQVKFITGTPDDPTTALNSTIYLVKEDGLQVATEFPTFGGTDASPFSINGNTYLIVANSLTKDDLFRQDSYVYRFKSNMSDHPEAREKSLERSPEVRKRQSALPGSSGYVTPQFVNLFGVYTSNSYGIGTQLSNDTYLNQTNIPMLVATSTDLLFYPGNGQDPSTITFRLGAGGFLEMASVSHLGPAMASLAQIKLLGKSDWRPHALHLLHSTQAAQRVNNESLWTDYIKVEAFQGREASIAAMIDYSCELTIRLLTALLADETKLTAEYLRDNFVLANSTATANEFNATIPYTHVMIATFFLIGLETAYSLQTWLNQYDIDWSTAMVLITGQIGRPTAGVTLSTNTMAQVFTASLPGLDIQRIYIAPGGPAPVLANTSADYLQTFEPELRGLWSSMNSMAGLGGQMFAGYPPYMVVEDPNPVINSSTVSVSEMPALSGPDDWFSLTDRMRVVLEDVRQLLSGCVVDYAAQQLYEHGFNYSKVVAPGIDGYNYSSAAASLR
ncbi:hypothetical protein OIDMADRAFT_146946 [Oidiodendron maius Zn]|uniref:DUF5624 domain-containing protein n=1 Tax=Oidiodendron maius (strain Zn) TaxID=913774 RepID=A0A0C3D8T9_OIDMZ|nr:hypothetical protein OIDMADRAFT_146946 [Oidiodendron maius Zn]